MKSLCCCSATGLFLPAAENSPLRLPHSSFVLRHCKNHTHIRFKAHHMLSVLYADGKWLKNMNNLDINVDVLFADP